MPASNLEGKPMLLKTENIVKTFGGLTAVNCISVEVANGEILGLIGPNGAGKTTFINCVSGTYKPSSGTVVFCDKETTGSSAEVMCRMGLARTFQIPRPFPKMTVLENVMVGAQFGADHGHQQSAKERAMETLDYVKFPLDYHTPANRLNAMQLKHLDLARALACGPKVLLLDELASGLTPGELDVMISLIKKIRDDRQLGMIVIEHIMKLIIGICDRVMVIQYGSLIAEGAPSEVMKNPRVVEAYLGDEEKFLPSSKK